MILLVCSRTACKDCLSVFPAVCSVVSGPTAGVVFDGENPDEDIDYTFNVATVTAHFSGFHSIVCGGIQHYEWSIGNGTDDGEKDSVMGLTSRGLTFSESEGKGRAQVCVRVHACVYVRTYMYVHMH